MTERVPYRPFTYLAANADRRSGAPAIYEAGETISFADFFQRVHAVVASLGELGVRPGEVVGVSLPNVWEYVALEIAIPALGAVILPLPPSLGTYELESALRRSSAAVVVTDEHGVPDVRGAAAKVPGLRSVVDVGDVVPVDRHVGSVQPHATLPEEIVQIALTSGTTGPPKLAALSGELKQLTFEGFTGRLRLAPGDRVLPLSPVSQGVGEMCLYTLRIGACLVMTHEHRFSAERALALTNDSGATVLGAVPTMIGRMFRSAAFDPEALRSVRVTAVAGAPMPAELAANWERRTGSRALPFLRRDGHRPARRRAPGRSAGEAVAHCRPAARARRGDGLWP